MVFDIHSHESAMGVHVFPILTLPPHPISQGHPRAPALSILPHASNLDWRSISHMIIYMFQCSSLKSSCPRLLLQSPTVCSLHLCLFCGLTYRIIVTIVLNSISSIQSLSHVQLFATPWIAACQASLSITNSQSSLRLMSIELVSHPLFSPSPPALNLS